MRQVVACLLVLGACLFVLQGRADDAPETALTGLWMLDRDRSDSPQRATRRALRDVERALRPRGNAPPGVPVADRARNVLDPLAPPRQSVRLQVEASKVTIHVDDRPPRLHFTDGRSTVVDATQPQVGVAGWEAGELHIEQSFDGGTRILETWRLESGHLRADYEARNSLFREPVRFTLRFLRESEP